jgi:hypothetical protein
VSGKRSLKQRGYWGLLVLVVDKPGGGRLVVDKAAPGYGSLTSVGVT